MLTSRSALATTFQVFYDLHGLFSHFVPATVDSMNCMNGHSTHRFHGRMFARRATFVFSILSLAPSLSSPREVPPVERTRQQTLHKPQFYCLRQGTSKRGRQSANQSIRQASSQSGSLSGNQAGRQVGRNTQFGFFFHLRTTITNAGEPLVCRNTQWLSG